MPSGIHRQEVLKLNNFIDPIIDTIVTYMSVQLKKGRCAGLSQLCLIRDLGVNDE